MTPFVYAFVRAAAERFDLCGDVLEVGSYNVNGQVRDIFEEKKPPNSTYLGIDFQNGPGVDKIVNALDLVAEFGEESFDVVICCDTLEHIDYFWIALEEMKSIVRSGGYLLITVPDFGVEVHRHPQDYWRFGEDSMHLLMSGFTLVHQDQIKFGWGIVGQKS